jgi:hypothetical protein
VTQVPVEQLEPQEQQDLKVRKVILVLKAQLEFLEVLAI